LGYILGGFFTNSFGHPARRLLFKMNLECICGLLNHFSASEEATRFVNANGSIKWLKLHFLKRRPSHPEQGRFSLSLSLCRKN
jgi:hypothetical protein